MTTIARPDGSLVVFGNTDLVDRDVLSDVHDWVEPHLPHVNRWDMGWLVARFVHADKPANRNGHIFPLEDLRTAYKLIPHTPLNMLHRKTHVIGAHVAAELLWPTEGQSMATGQPSTPWVETLASVWRLSFPDEYRAIKENVRDGLASTSMECWPESLTCDTCGAMYAFDGITSDKYTCGHLADRRAPKWLNKPHFVGGAVVLPPAIPGWKDAAIQRVAAFFEHDWAEADRIFREVAAQFEHLEPSGWEQQMGLLLQAAGVQMVASPKKKKRRAGYSAPAAAKTDKTTVNYRTAAHVTVSCGTCAHYDPETRSCDLVDGDIDPGMLCDLWEARESGHATDAAPSTSAMVAIYPPPDVAADLAAHGTEGVDQIHVTVLYLGKLADLNGLTATQAAGFVGEVAAVTEPMTAKISGLARFALDDGQEATVALVDAPGLSEFHNRLRGRFVAAGSEPAHSHDFTAHAALAYHAPGEGPAVMPASHAWKIGDMHVVWGDDHTVVPFNGSAAAAALVDRTFSTEQRKELAKKGWARPDGSYPIENEQDLRNAIQAFGRANEGDRAAVKAHIKRAASRLGRTDLLPDDWD